MIKKILLFFFISFFLFLPFYFWQGIYLPKDKGKSEEIIFTVNRGEGLFEIASNLEKEGLVKKRYFFILYVLLQRKEKNLVAGKYKLSPSMNVPEIAEKIILGKTTKVKITFPEGLNLKQVNDLLFLNKVIGDSILDFQIKDFKGRFEFLDSVPDNLSLEGFLFPQTYFFDLGMRKEEIVATFLKMFEEEVFLKEEIRKEKERMLEIITMASLVEKEVYNTPQCPDCKNLVAGILWKRLKNNMPLQVDATISYITGKKTTKISIEETKMDNPYNTYKYIGLPPGPICNPGLESILAVIQPKESDYWYYLSTPEGETIFSKTLEEHNLNKAKYLF